MPNLIVHQWNAAALLLVWIMAVLSFSCLSLSAFAVVFLLLTIAILYNQPHIIFSSLKRMRWLLLSLIGLMAWTNAGEALWQSRWAPTKQGMILGLEHAAKILAAVWLIRLIWTAVGQVRLLAALYVLVKPFSKILGFSPEVWALRMGLTLRYTEDYLALGIRQSAQSLKNVLASENSPSSIKSEDLTIAIECWHFRDLVLIVFALLLLIVSVKV